MALIEQQEIVQALVNLVARAPHALDSGGIIDADPVLFKKARAAFGTWEDALAAALCSLARQGKTQTSRATAAAEETHDRQLMEGWDSPLFVLSHEQSLGVVSASALGVQHQAPVQIQTLGPEETPWRLDNLQVGWSEGHVVLVSHEGVATSVDERLIPNLDQTGWRSVAEIAGFDAEARVDAMLLRRSLRTSRRICHLSAQGRIKASECSDLVRTMGRDTAQAFLLAPGDVVTSVFGQGPERPTIFCANRQGNGIHFKASEVRTMGLRAQGVKAMDLGAEDALVGGSSVCGDEHILVLSELGYGKRVSLEEFRVQGRGGQGMILMRPHIAGDAVARVALLSSLDEDVLVLTTRGRLARVAATAFSLLGRAAKGLPMLALDEGERVKSLHVLPGAG